MTYRPCTLENVPPSGVCPCYAHLVSARAQLDFKAAICTARLADFVIVIHAEGCVSG